MDTNENNRAFLPSIRENTGNFRQFSDEEALNFPFTEGEMFTLTFISRILKIIIQKGVLKPSTITLLLEEIKYGENKESAEIRSAYFYFCQDMYVKHASVNDDEIVEMAKLCETILELYLVKQPTVEIQEKKKADCWEFTKRAVHIMSRTHQLVLDEFKITEGKENAKPRTF